MTEGKAILLLHCPDRQGIIADVTGFITRNHGNIVYLDQYVDTVEGHLFMRVEWELKGFFIPRDHIQEVIDELKASGDPLFKEFFDEHWGGSLIRP